MSGESLRLLTYNVQMRPWAAEVGAQGTLTPNTSEETRADAIADRILAAPRGFDVLCLTEVFDEDGRDVLQKRLGAQYPHMVLKAEADDAGGGALSIVTGVLAVALPITVWTAALGITTWAFGSRAVWEDSGLMLLSRVPFGQIPTPDEIQEEFASIGLTVPASMPNVAFVAYEDAQESDRNASKGVLYAELRPEPEKRVHVLMSHTQADPVDEIGKHAVTRAKQFAQVRRLLEEKVGSPPWQEEVIFCGDLNVNGMVNELGQWPEWEAVFEADDSWMREHLYDVWHYEQCPGDVPGTTPLPRPCDPGPTNHLQRLDYFLRPPNALADRRMTQHIWIPHDLAQNANDPLSQNSDHLPLALDLGPANPHCSAITAEVVTFDDADIEQQDFVSDFEGLFDGQMHWYRINQPGGYGIGLTQGENDVDVDIFTYMDMSRPKPAYTSTREVFRESPPLTKYALPLTPWFIRVAMKNRHGDAGYQLHVHRYRGRGPQDAIPLARRVLTPGVAHPSEPHSFDLAPTPFSEHDAVWFKVWLDSPPPGRSRVADTVFLTSVADNAFGLLMYADSAGGPVLLGETGSGADPVVLNVDHDAPAWAYILVRREKHPSPSTSTFQIEFLSDMSYLYSDQSRESRAFASAMLFCTDETDGVLPSIWPFEDALAELGSDDIAININSGGQTVVRIDHSDMLTFDDDSRRNVDAPVVPYAGELEYELVEEDDFSASDRARVMIPQFDEVINVAERLVRVEPDRIEASFRIDFEPGDGHYHLTATVSFEPPIRP